MQKMLSEKRERSHGGVGDNSRVVRVVGKQRQWWDNLYKKEIVSTAALKDAVLQERDSQKENSQV
jgi:hypothetical protein